VRRHSTIWNEAGLTLTEVVVVLVIIGILAITTLPIVGSFLGDTKARGAAEQVGSAFRQARQNAISAAATYVVTITSTNIRITCTDNVPAGNVCPVTRPPDRDEPVTTGAGVDPSTPNFNLGPTGDATPGTVDVTYGSTTWQVAVNPTGGVRLCTPSCP
jgi:prepilin-type N-terminal cleavage/methylation domain-containing protein